MLPDTTATMASNLDLGALSLQNSPQRRQAASPGSFGYHASPQRASGAGGDFSAFRAGGAGTQHARGPSASGGLNGEIHQQSQQQQQQSASARFERFFASADPSGLPPAPVFPGAFDANAAALGGSLPQSQFGDGASGTARRGLRHAMPQWAPNGAPEDSRAWGYPQHQPQQHAPPPPMVDDEVIPTAIVIKNIPFSIKREQLLALIEELGVPVPYAFNYHYDQGIFRGLAFANFRSGEEADSVVAALNGFDVSGRKLKVEYKKVLQAGEKERIEKEKALKRMHSMQMEREKERERRMQEDANAAAMGGMPPFPSHHAVHQQHGLRGQNAVDSPQGGYGDVYASRPVPLTVDTLQAAVGGSGDDVSPRSLPSDIGAEGGAPGAGASGAGGSRKEELNLNEPGTLEIYSRVLLFKDDRMRDELAFSKNLSPLERRTVHLVAQRLGLYHYSVGDGDERCVIVSKNETPQNHRPLRTQASTIGRSHRGIDGLAPPFTSNGLLSPGGSATTGRAGLRAKKSAPDLKPRGGHDYGGYGAGGLGGPNGPSAANSPRFGAADAAAAQHPHAHGLSAFKSNGNLREGYSSTLGRRSVPVGAAGLQSLFSSPYEVPPVPTLGGPMANSAAALENGHYGNSSSSSSNMVNGHANGLAHSFTPPPLPQQAQAPSQQQQQPQQATNTLRQPRGPAAAGAGNFARSRVPGPGPSALPNGHAHSGASPTSNGSASSSPAPAPAQAAGSASASAAPGGSDAYASSHLHHDHGVDAQSHTPLEF